MHIYNVPIHYNGDRWWWTNDSQWFSFMRHSQIIIETNTWHFNVDNNQPQSPMSTIQWLSGMFGVGASAILFCSAPIFLFFSLYTVLSITTKIFNFGSGPHKNIGFVFYCHIHSKHEMKWNSNGKLYLSIENHMKTFQWGHMLSLIFTFSFTFRRMGVNVRSVVLVLVRFVI